MDGWFPVNTHPNPGKIIPMQFPNSVRNRLTIFTAIIVWLFAASFACAQITPQQQADMLLNSARKAYNEKNYPFAAVKFREFLGKFGGHKEAPAARFGLALALIEGSDRKYDEARDLLIALAALKDFPDRVFAGYYAAIAVRGQGLSDLEKADAIPNEAVRYRANAQIRFNEAIPLLNSAIAAFSAKAQKPLENNKLTVDAEWVARARCDLAELQLRVGKLKEAKASAAPFVGDPVWSKSQYRNLGRYYYGYASVLLKDHAAGEKTLSMLAPFNDPVFGNHARYLLARTHHLADERAEAMAHYEGTIADYAANKEVALKYLRIPRTDNDYETRVRMEALVRNTPDHVARATFYLGVLLYEGGKFADAKTRFAEFARQFPKSPLRLEAEVRIGYCLVQMRDYPEAIRTLTPLADKDARLADQVYYWLGKAKTGAAPDANANQTAHYAAIAVAINTFRTAAERARRPALRTRKRKRDAAKSSSKWPTRCSVSGRTGRRPASTANC